MGMNPGLITKKMLDDVYNNPSEIKAAFKPNNLVQQARINGKYDYKNEYKYLNLKIAQTLEERHPLLVEMQRQIDSINPAFFEKGDPTKTILTNRAKYDRDSRYTNDLLLYGELYYPASLHNSIGNPNMFVPPPQV